jgi:hypothetical protein
MSRSRRFLSSVAALPAALLLTTGSVLLASPPAIATSIAPLTLDQLVDASDAIVIGTVRHVGSYIDTTGRVYTEAEVEVGEVLKGQRQAGVSANDWLVVESPGGSLDAATATEVWGAARYSTDERVLLFLDEKRFGTAWGTVGMSHGKFTIRQNPAAEAIQGDSADMVVRFTLPYSRPYDARFIPNPPAAERVSLATMKAAIADRVDQGWDGKPIPGVSNEHLREINTLQPGVK